MNLVRAVPVPEVALRAGELRRGSPAGGDLHDHPALVPLTRKLGVLEVVEDAGGLVDHRAAGAEPGHRVVIRRVHADGTGRGDLVDVPVDGGCDIQVVVRIDGHPTGALDAGRSRHEQGGRGADRRALADRVRRGAVEERLEDVPAGVHGESGRPDVPPVMRLKRCVVQSAAWRELLDLAHSPATVLAIRGDVDVAEIVSRHPPDVASIGIPDTRRRARCGPRAHRSPSTYCLAINCECH